MENKKYFFVDFDGTIIPDIEFKDEKSFRNLTVNADVDMAYIDKYKLLPSFSNWCILTNRPANEIKYINMCLENSLPEYLNRVVYSSYPAKYHFESFQMDEVCKRKALLMVYITSNLIHTKKINSFSDVVYIDGNSDTQNTVNELFNNIVSMLYPAKPEIEVL